MFFYEKSTNNVYRTLDFITWCDSVFHTDAKIQEVGCVLEIFYN